MPVGSAPNGQETDDRESGACSQGAEPCRCPKEEWQSQKEKSRIRSRSELIKNSETDREQTEKEKACLQ